MTAPHEYTFTVYRNAEAAPAVTTEEEWDPCGLEDVVCDGERTGVEKAIADVFPEEPETMIAVAKAESGLRTDSTGWNCYYEREDGTKYSTACNVEDRAKAWSVDCGLMQINTPGKVCPAELFDVEHNLSVAREKYERQGKDAWYAYRSAKYKKYL